MFPLDEKKARKRFLKSFGILGLIMCALTIGIGNFYVYFHVKKGLLKWLNLVVK